MMLFPKDVLAQLIANGREAAAAIAKDGETADRKPVVKLFLPDGSCTWLLTEVDPEDQDRAFGLCDLGFGEPELGYVSIAEITGVRGRFGLKVERDIHFKAEKTITEYAAEALRDGQIAA